MSDSAKNINRTSNHEEQETALALGARLKLPPSDLLVDSAFRYELDHQLALNPTMGLVDMAHILSAVEDKVIPKKEGYKLLSALLQLHLSPEEFKPSPELGDLYTNREAWLNQKTDATVWLCVGRARREATTGAFHIKIRDQLLQLSADLIDTAKKITYRAKLSSTDLMPDYTYLQKAQPTTLGHYLLGFVFPILRDLSRISNCYERFNLSPLGCGSTNGSLLQPDRHRTANKLGFDGLCTHTRDAMWQADLSIELSANLTAIMVNMDRLAEDLQVFCTEEFALIELSDQHSRSSKIMPQKKNPFALTYIRQLANQLIGLNTTCSASGRTPSGQPDNRLYIYGALPEALNEVCRAVKLMGEVIEHMYFDKVQAKAALNSSSTLATNLAEVFVKETGLDPRSAHRLSGNLVSQHMEHNSFLEITIEDIETTANTLLSKEINLSKEMLKNALDSSMAIESHTETGGASSEAIQLMILSCNQTITKHQLWLTEVKTRVEGCYTTLLEDVEEICEKNDG